MTQTFSEWEQMKKHLKEDWKKLTDDNLNDIEGDKDRLIEKISERHQLAEDATTRFEDWYSGIDMY